MFTVDIALFMACWSQTALNDLWHKISLKKTVPTLWSRLHPALTGVFHSVPSDSRPPRTIPPNLWYPPADSCQCLPGVYSPTQEAWNVTGTHREFIRPHIVLIDKGMPKNTLAHWLIENPGLMLILTISHSFIYIFLCMETGLAT